MKPNPTAPTPPPARGSSSWISGNANERRSLQSGANLTTENGFHFSFARAPEFRPAQR